MSIILCYAIPIIVILDMIFNMIFSTNSNYIRNNPYKNIPYLIFIYLCLFRLIEINYIFYLLSGFIFSLMLPTLSFVVTFCEFLAHIIGALLGLTLYRVGFH